jgi:hypothetical protein
MASCDERAAAGAARAPRPKPSAAAASSNTINTRIFDDDLDDLVLLRLAVALR